MSKSIPSNIRSLADTLKSEAKVDNATGIVSFPEDSFEKSLPEDLSKEQFAKAQAALADYTIAGALATGELAKDVFKENDTIDRVVSTSPFEGKSSITHKVERVKTGKTPSTGETWTKHNVLSTQIDHSFSSTRRGQLKQVADYLASEADEVALNNA